MRLILASSNKGKAKEIAALLAPCDVTVYSELIEPIAIDENGADFAQNALIKARAVFAALGDPSALVIADDSGVVAPILGENVPGIHSARYAGLGASDKDNLSKMIDAIKAKGVDRTPAYYEAAIALKSEKGERTASGRLEGAIVVESRGAFGFGYDPIFIPKGFKQTLGELSPDIKASISHRAKAIERIKPFLGF
ncbi:MAG: non-canonical purine NTP pyrophosphatase [Helicobacteraceae bacterium]|jgi:XTP/dITP diphosphohydrolase|nr:non-canonical purine NTP pyrophosphatase [Helicobacteraceae bacterium]